jgi:hypothetical protein
MKTFLPFVLLVALPTSLLAHDFYILPANFIVAPKARIEVRLQNGDSLPDSEAPGLLGLVLLSLAQSRTLFSLRQTKLWIISRKRVLTT